MTDLAAVMNALRDQLATACPSRVVSRDLRDFNEQRRADLLSGVFMLVAQGEGQFANYVGREADLGILRVILVGQIELEKNAAPGEIEDAEFAMIGELKAFCAGTLGDPISGLYLKNWRQSGQLEAPYGWIAAEIEVQL